MGDRALMIGRRSRITNYLSILRSGSVGLDGDSSSSELHLAGWVDEEVVELSTGAAHAGNFGSSQSCLTPSPIEKVSENTEP